MREISELTEMTEKIRQRAYELFQARGCEPGHEEEDWLQAERDLLEGTPQRHQNQDPVIQEAFDLNGIDGRELNGEAPAAPRRRARAR